MGVPLMESIVGWKYVVSKRFIFSPTGFGILSNIGHFEEE